MKWWLRWIIGVPLWLLSILIGANGKVAACAADVAMHDIGVYVMQFGYSLAGVIMFWVLGLISVRSLKA